MAKIADAIKSYARNTDAIIEAAEVVDLRFAAGRSLSLHDAQYD